MKTFHSIFFAVVASLVLGVESSSDTIKNIFLNERRFLLYNSRSLEGNCCKFRCLVIATTSIKFFLVFLTEIHFQLVVCFYSQ
jgi:hypothetical protein